MDDKQSSDIDDYVLEMTRCQGQLRAFIFAALANHANTADVLQRTNLVLWKKADEFRTGEDFMPWAAGIARYEVLAFLRDSRRDKLVFVEDVAVQLMNSAERRLLEPGDRQLALSKCVEALPATSRDLLWQRYDENKSIRQIATDSGKTEDSIKCFFLRLRRSLERCVKTRMQIET